MSFSRKYLLSYYNINKFICKSSEEFRGRWFLRVCVTCWECARRGLFGHAEHVGENIWEGGGCSCRFVCESSLAIRSLQILHIDHKNYRAADYIIGIQGR